MHILPKMYCTQTSIVALLSTSVDLSAWIFIPWWLINLNNCASISSAISSIYLVTVLAERGTCATSWTADSPKSSWQRSLAAGRINSSPIAKGFLALAMWLATKQDALSADTFDEGMTVNNFFCFLHSCFFLLKTPKAYLLLQGVWSPCGGAVLKVSWLCWISSRHVLYKAGLENVNHML